MSYRQKQSVHVRARLITEEKTREAGRTINRDLAVRAGGQGPGERPVRASQISDFYSLLDGLPKLDLVAIRVRYPCEFPISFVVFTLINRHALRLEMRKSFRHAFYAVVNPTRSWLIRDVLISGHNRPRYRSLDLRIFKIPIFKRCVD